MEQFRRSSARMHKDQIISQLIQEKIITTSPDKSFTYVGGMFPPIYTDLYLTASYPELHDMIASDLANLIAKEFPEVTIAGGIATVGIPHAALVAGKLHLPMVYVRPESEDHGKGRQIEGRFLENDKIALIDNLVTTDDSVPSAVKTTEKDGGHVTGVSSTFTYYLSDAKESFKEAGVKYAPPLSYPELLKKESESGHITSEQCNILRTWHEDSWTRGKKFNN